MGQVFTARRIYTDGLSTVSRWFAPGGAFLCYGLEPGFERTPFPGIPSGRYPLRLYAPSPVQFPNAKHAAYLRRYGPVWHKGMVEICDVPGRSAILYHVGNTIDDSKGCTLGGKSIVEPRLSSSRHWEVARSREAYEEVYEVLRDAILAGPTWLDIQPVGAAGA